MMKLHVRDWREAPSPVRVINLSAEVVSHESVGTLFVGAATEAPSMETKKREMIPSLRVVSMAAQCGTEPLFETSGGSPSPRPEQFSLSSALPRTPALPLGEREERPTARPFDAPSRTVARSTPSPWGEGWDEGDRDARMTKQVYGDGDRPARKLFERTELTSLGEIHLLRQSFELVAPMADSMVEAFYRRLFELEPDLRSMLPPGFTREGRKLIQRLRAALGMLEQPDRLVSMLESLAQNQSGCSVSHEHYYIFAEALLWAFERGLGPLFTPEVEAAWISFCEVVITITNDVASGQSAQFELAEAVAC